MTTQMNEHIKHSNLIEGVRDYAQIEQSLMAWQYLEKQTVLTEFAVLNVHNLVMLTLMPQRVGGRGSYRIHNVEVGGRPCPHWREVPGKMDVWIESMSEFTSHEPKDMHIAFEHIHPFRDGNGRTGRMLMWWHEIKLDRNPTLITYDERWDYYAWF